MIRVIRSGSVRPAERSEGPLHIGFWLFAGIAIGIPAIICTMLLISSNPEAGDSLLRYYLKNSCTVDQYKTKRALAVLLISLDYDFMDNFKCSFTVT